MEKVSIIIPVYNIEQYIRKSVESAVNQTYSDIEIIIVNDGSTDSSLKIVKEYARIDSRIKIINKNNGGLSSARNAGLDQLSGSFILFLDGDDYLDRNAVSILLKPFIDNQIDISVGSADNIYLKGTKDLFNDTSYRLQSETIKSIDAVKMYYEDKKTILLSSCFKLYRKELFDNLRFNDGVIHEDAYIFPILFGRARNVALCSNILFHYVHRENSITSSKLTTKYIEEDLKYHRYLCDYYKGTEIYKMAYLDFCDTLINLGKKCDDINYRHKMQKDFRQQWKNIILIRPGIKKMIKFVLGYINFGLLNYKENV